MKILKPTNNAQRNTVMKSSKSKAIKKTSPDSITKMQQALFLLKLEKRAGRLLKTQQIKVLKKEVARNLTKINQQKSTNQAELKAQGGNT